MRTLAILVLPISLCILSAGDGRRRYDRRDLPSAASSLRSKRFETLRRCLHHMRKRDDGDLHNGRARSRGRGSQSRSRYINRAMVLAMAGEALTPVVGEVEEGAALLSSAINLDPNHFIIVREYFQPLRVSSLRLLISSRVALGVSACGSTMQCKIAGLPEARARSNAGAKSGVCSTRSPKSPKSCATAAKSGFFNRVAEILPG